ncbi:MAG TPA: hypothetical protein VK753_02475 [Xanthomonadaceae bacterium]|nr:hypothetical protein [Xanthomonadaceae bacterium]
MTLRCLFVDFDSYFASVEQYDDPGLRGQPVGVVPVMADSTCCLAASYEAKAVGVKTGTGVREARAKCPGIRLVLARPARYIELHHQLMRAIEDCIPHAKPLSVDEVPCYLIGRERQRKNAEAIACSIKQRLIDLGFSPAIHCSIGIAPNRFLAKTASDMDKPNGLTVIESGDLPHKLHLLELRDFCGIGPSMEARLRVAGIRTAEQLCAATREHLRAAWGSIEGERYWLQLRGFDVPDRKTARGSVGHSHVLGPELRNFDGMRAVMFKLLAKAAMRLRHEEYVAGGLTIRIRFVGTERRFERDLHFAPIDDTPTLLHLLAGELQVLQGIARSGRWNPKRHPPLSVAVTLVGLEPGGCMTAELMPERERAKTVSGVLDRINQRYGNNALYFGAMQDAISQNAAPMRIPFSTIPDTVLEEDAGTKRPAWKRGAHDSDHELWLQRERQFKVLAEQTHREAQQKRKPHKPSGAGGWAPRQDASKAVESTSSSLF